MIAGLFLAVIVGALCGFALARAAGGIVRALLSIRTPATSSRSSAGDSEARGQLCAGLPYPVGDEVPSPLPGAREIGVRRDGEKGTHAGQQCAPLAPKWARRDPGAAYSPCAAPGRGKGAERQSASSRTHARERGSCSCHPGFSRRFGADGNALARACACNACECLCSGFGGAHCRCGCDPARGAT
jgi:hypothetical protein